MSNDKAMIVRTAKKTGNIFADEDEKRIKMMFAAADAAAQKALDDFHIHNGLVFNMEERSISEIRDMPDDMPYRARYVAKNNDAVYYLLVNAKDEEDEFPCFYTMLYKEEKGEYTPFDPYGRKWVTSKDFSTVCKMIKASCGVEELLDDVTVWNGMFPQQIGSEEAKNFILKNEKIITLRENIGEGAMVIAMNIHRSKDMSDPTQLAAAIVPADGMIRGSMIFMDDNGYHLCQYIAEEDVMAHEIIIMDKEISDCAAENVNEFINIVCTSDREEEIKKIMLSVLGDDEYENSIFSFPISDSKRVVMEQLGGGCAICGKDTEDITKEEKENINKLMRAVKSVLTQIGGWDEIKRE